MPQPPPGDGTAILPRLVAAVESRWPQLVEAVTSLQRGAEAGLQDRAAVAARVRSLVTSGPGSAVAHVRRLEAMSHLVWERLNTGHWAEVWPGWRRLYGLLMVARVAAVARLARDGGPGHHEDTVRDLVRMCDLGLLLGGPDLLGGMLETLAQDMTEHLSSTGEDFAEASVSAKKARLAAPRPRLSEHSLRLPLPLSEVATASCPSIPEFVASCVAPRRVTRLTGAMEDWPALQLWSPRHLVRLAGPRTVPVELGGRCIITLNTSLSLHTQYLSSVQVHGPRLDPAADDGGPVRVRAPHLAAARRPARLPGAASAAGPGARAAPRHPGAGLLLHRPTGALQNIYTRST